MSKILIVEDDEVLSKIFQKKIESTGFKVIAAYSGNEGLTAAQKEKPDLILMDIMMPGMDGFHVIKALKENAETKNTPIIILTNLGTSEIFISEAKRLGVKAYLVKYKTSANEVVETIQKELGRG